MTAVRTLAPAKLNLTLDVGALRSDGYHDLRSIMVAIDLVDVVTVELSDRPAFRLAGPVAVEGLEGETNLAWRALRLLGQRFSIPPVSIVLEKHIPAAAGLGGGSSDAAATIRAVAALLQLGIGSQGQAELGAELGSDVPFFARGGAALVEGRGERVTALSDAALVFTLAWPAFDLPRKTETMFGLLDRKTRTPGEATARLLGHWPAVADGDLGNDFESVMFEGFPRLSVAWEAMAACDTSPHLAGAGPSVFALCTSEVTAQARARALAGRVASATVARSLGAVASTVVERLS